MEMFLRNPFPDDERYINFEINPAGAMVMDLHRTRKDKEELVSRYKRRLGLTVFGGRELGRGFYGAVCDAPSNLWRLMCASGRGRPVRQFSAMRGRDANPAFWHVE